MKMHKFTITFVDFENYGIEAYEHFLEHMRESPLILDKQTADIGEWSDYHPVNKFETTKEEIEKYFEV